MIPILCPATDRMQDVRALVRDFETGVLPRARWTHGAFLRVSLWYLLVHGWRLFGATARRRFVAPDRMPLPAEVRAALRRVPLGFSGTRRRPA